MLQILFQRMNHAILNSNKYIISKNYTLTVLILIEKY